MTTSDTIKCKVKEGPARYDKLLVEDLIEYLNKEGYAEKTDLKTRREIIKRVLHNKLMADSEILGYFIGLLYCEYELSDIKSAWGYPLDLLDAEIGVSRLACYYFLIQTQSVFNSGSTPPASTINLADALIRLSARACRVASEICCLLRNGYPDGALARLRTLYEIEVVSKFIRAKSSSAIDLAGRYLDCWAIEEKNDLKERVEYLAILASNLKKNVPPQKLTAEQDEELEKGRLRLKELDGIIEKLSSKHASRFWPGEGSYGWAYEIIGKKYPKLDDLESSIGYHGEKNIYNVGCRPVHVGPAEAIFPKSVISPQHLLFGRSRREEGIIIHHTAVSIDNIIHELCFSFNSMQIGMTYDIIYGLVDEIILAVEDCKKKFQ